MRVHGDQRKTSHVFEHIGPRLMNRVTGAGVGRSGAAARPTIREIQKMFYPVDIPGDLVGRRMGKSLDCRRMSAGSSLRSQGQQPGHSPGR